jgi:hypothetical protein
MSVVFILFWITFGAFVADVLLGKFGVISGGDVNQLLGYVSHFLLLALAAALFIAECLRRETVRDNARQATAASIDSKTPTN